MNKTCIMYILEKEKRMVCVDEQSLHMVLSGCPELGSPYALIHL